MNEWGQLSVAIRDLGRAVGDLKKSLVWFACSLVVLWLAVLALVILP